MLTQTCEAPDCIAIRYQKRLCTKHYFRMRNKGCLEPEPVIGPAQQALRDAIVSETNSCVEWAHSLTPSGYAQVWSNGRHARVTHLVLEARVGPKPSPAHIAMHGPCHNTACVNWRHLSWGTHTENAADKLRDNTHRRGERSPVAKLTVAKVEAIEAFTALGYIQKDVAAIFGVSRQTVYSITSGTNWRFRDAS